MTEVISMITDFSPYQALALDIDGTLLRSDHSVSREVIRALNALEQLDIAVILASARPPSSVALLVKDTRLHGPFIALNGAFVGSETTICQRAPMDPGGLNALLTLCRADPAALSVNLYSDWAWYVTHRDDRVAAESRIVGFEPNGLWPPEDEPTPEVEKVLVIGRDNAPERLERLLAALPASLEGTISKPGYLEVTSRGVSKKGALQTLIGRWGLTRDALVAVGDGDNDQAMVASAGLGVAMGNGSDRLKSIADLVVASNDDDGLLDLLLPWIDAKTRMLSPLI